MFGKRLRMAREAKGLTMDELVDLYKSKFPNSGLNKGTLSKYENEKQEPMISTVNKLSEVLNVSVDYLSGKNTPDIPPAHKPDAEAFNIVEFPEMHKVPIYGTVAASFGVCAVEDALGFEYTDRKDYENCCWLLVHGHSMEPEIHEGDFVLIDKDSDIENGDIVAARIDEDDGTVKKYEYSNGVLSLRPINPACTPKMFAGKDKKRVRIVGKVVEVKRKY